VEITKRFPQVLGNLAQTARFPHSHKLILVYEEREETDKTEHKVLPMYPV
jgi:hypothetical protein